VGAGRPQSIADVAWLARLAAAHSGPDGIPEMREHIARLRGLAFQGAPVMAMLFAGSRGRDF
jgi:hypothetical protein